MNRPARLLAVAVLPLAVALSACGANPGEVTASVRAAAATHTGPWTDADRRAATGEFSHRVVDTEVLPDGGIVVVELSSSSTSSKRSSSRRSPSSPASSSRSKTYKVRCLTVTIDDSARGAEGAAAVTSDTYSVESRSTFPGC